jgi:hypothetical protein
LKKHSPTLDSSPPPPPLTNKKEVETLETLNSLLEREEGRGEERRSPRREVDGQ